MMKAFVFLSVLAIIAGLACSSSLPVQKVKVPVKEVQSTECDVCKIVVQVLEKFALENSTETEVKQEIEEFCKSLPSEVSQTCSDLVDQYFDEIWAAIINDESPEDICTDIGLCTSKKFIKVAPEVPVKEVQSTECDLCKLVVQVLEQFALENSTEAEVKQEIEEFCKSLPSAVSQTCSDLVDKYFDQIWAAIINDESPEDICTDIGLCTSKKFIKVAPEVPVKKVDVSIECTICKIVAQAVEKYAEENSTEAEIKQELEKLCNDLPSSLSGTCLDIVNNNFDMIWKDIINGETPEDICSDIDLCTSKKFIEVTPKQTVCDYCKVIVSFLAVYIDENKTEEEIENDLETLCNIFPGSIGTECNDFVKEYFPIIYEFVKEEYENDLICYQIMLCSNSSKLRENPKLITPHSNQSCQLCKAVAAFLKPFVDSTPDEDDVKKALKNFCNLLPNTNNVSAECMTYVNEYFIPIWTLVRAEVDSGEICSLLGFCKNETQAVEIIEGVEQIRKQEAGILCVICEYVMKEIEAQLPLNATEADIIKVVMDICDALPTTIQKECTDFINEYGQEIINALINDVGPNAVCALIHACSIENAAVMETPVGDSKCSWGPAYWCSTPEAAIECNAKDYCSGLKQL